MTSPTAAEVAKLIRDTRAPTTDDLQVCPEILWIACENEVVKLECKGDKAAFIAAAQQITKEHP